MTKTSNRRQLLVLTLGLLIAVPAISATAPKPNQTEDLCVVRRSLYTGNALDTLVFQGVEPLRPGRTISLRGIYFTPIRIPTPFHGSAVMASDGTIRIGILVHHSARNQYDGNVYTSDKTFSGMTDVNLAGTLNADFNGDAIPEGILTFVSEDCTTITIP